MTYVLIFTVGSSSPLFERRAITPRPLREGFKKNIFMEFSMEGYHP